MKRDFVDRVMGEEISIGWKILDGGADFISDLPSEGAERV